MNVRFNGVIFWFCSVLMFVLGLMLQISFGLFTVQLVKDLHLDTSEVSYLIASTAYLHIFMQSVGGAIVDRFGARVVMGVGCLISALAGWGLMHADQFYSAVLFRLIMGFGLSCGFLCISFLSANWMPARFFGLMVSLAEMCGVFGSCVLEISLASKVETMSWRGFTGAITVVIFVLGIVSLVIIRDRPSHMESDYPRASWRDLYQQFINLLSMGRVWINGMYSGALFSVLTGFCASWGPHFFALARKVSLHQGAVCCGYIMVGMGIGAGFVGWISTRDIRFPPVMCLMSFFCAVCMGTVIILPQLNSYVLYSLLFIVGFSASSYLLSFSVAYGFVPAGGKTSIMGMTNMMSVLLGPILLTLTSYVMEWIACSDQVKSVTYSVLDYQLALALYPLVLVWGFLLALRLKRFDEQENLL